MWPKAWHIVGSHIQAVFTTGNTGYYEKSPVPIAKIGIVFDSYLTYSYCPVYKSGQIAGVYGPLLNVTAEGVTELQLVESEARSSRILESIGDAVFVTDEETCIIRMNAVAETVTGWEIEEASGQPLAAVFNIVNEETRLVVGSPAEKVKQTGSIVGLANHTVLISKSGTEIHIDDSGAQSVSTEVLSRASFSYSVRSQSVVQPNESESVCNGRCSVNTRK